MAFLYHWYRRLVAPVAWLWGAMGGLAVLFKLLTAVGLASAVVAGLVALFYYLNGPITLPIWGLILLFLSTFILSFTAGQASEDSGPSLLVDPLERDEKYTTFFIRLENN